MKNNVWIVYNDVIEDNIPAVFFNEKAANEFRDFLNHCGHVGEYKVLKMKPYNSLREYVSENKNQYSIYLSELQLETKKPQEEDVEQLLK